jgi:hypothetical protein
MRSHISDAQARLKSGRFRGYILSAGLSLILSLTLFTSTAFAGGNDLIGGELRVDLASVNLAHDYIVHIQTAGLPTNGGSLDFTAGWLGIDAPAFLQVGYMTRKAGVHWFVEEFSGGVNNSIQCFQGAYKIVANGGEACYGDYYDHAAIGGWHKVELVTYANEGSWIARVHDRYGNPLDVARINYGTSTNKITRAMVTTEETYTGTSDPHMLAYFFYSHPQYFIGGSGNPFAQWPATSGTNRNYLRVQPSTICPTWYFATLNYGGDPRIWYAGTKTQGSGVCSGNIF